VGLQGGPGVPNIRETGPAIQDIDDTLGRISPWGAWLGDRKRSTSPIDCLVGIDQPSQTHPKERGTGGLPGPSSFLWPKGRDFQFNDLLIVHPRTKAKDMTYCAGAISSVMVSVLIVKVYVILPIVVVCGAVAFEINICANQVRKLLI